MAAWMYRDGGNNKFRFEWNNVFPDIAEPIRDGDPFSLSTFGIDAEGLHNRLVDAGVKEYEFDEELDHDCVEADFDSE